MRQSPQAPGQSSASLSERVLATAPASMGLHLTAAPWPGGKGKFPPGPEICSHLRLDADVLSISGVNVVPTPRVWFEAERQAGWELLSPSP